MKRIARFGILVFMFGAIGLFVGCDEKSEPAGGEGERTSDETTKSGEEANEQTSEKAESGDEETAEKPPEPETTALGEKCPCMPPQGGVYECAECEGGVCSALGGSVVCTQRCDTAEDCPDPEAWKCMEMVSGDKVCASKG